MRSFISVIFQLSIVPVAIILLPATVRAAPNAITCEVKISLHQGVALTYQLTGTQGSDTAEAVPHLSNLVMTLQRQDPRDSVQTLLSRSPVSEYAQIAPDADYSQLPFEEPFRTQPNNASGLYALPTSVHGLYASLRADGEQSYQMQIVHFLEESQPVRSAPGICWVDSAATTEAIAPIQQSLENQEWAEADRATRQLLSSETNLFPNSPEPVSAELIRAIDRTWLTASEGRFGLSVQAEIWQAAQAAYPNDNSAAVNTFRDSVGWKFSEPRPDTDFISSNWLNESEIDYSLQAPVGHLPWAGIADEVVMSVAFQDGCGSCTPDAMHLRNQRFYEYLPHLFSQVEAAY